MLVDGPWQWVGKLESRQFLGANGCAPEMAIQSKVSGGTRTGTGRMASNSPLQCSSAQRCSTGSQYLNSGHA